MTMTNENPISIRKSRRARLWNNASDYILSFLPGRGLDCVYKGARQLDPICIAIYDWVQSVWDLYYERVESLPDGDVPEEFFSFLVCGEIPIPGITTKEESL